VGWNRIRFSGRGGREQLCAKWEQRPAATVSQETKVPDADESTRQHMQQEATQELIHGQGEKSLLIFVSGIPPAKSDIAFGKRNQTVIGDRHPVGICAEIT